MVDISALSSAAETSLGQLLTVANDCYEAINLIAPACFDRHCLADSRRT
jgi:hypothetical protein